MQMIMHLSGSEGRDFPYLFIGIVKARERPAQFICFIHEVL